MCKLKSAVTAVKSQINFQLELLPMIDRLDIETEPQYSTL